MIRVNFFLIITLLITLSLSSPPSFAQDAIGETATAIATRLQEKYDSLTSLSFKFSQKTKGNLSGRPRTASGQAFFLKNEDAGKMRWNYLVPDEQVLISDGTTFQMYFSKLQQMIIAPAETLQQDITYTFFSGKGNLLRDFHIFPPDPHYAPETGTNSSVKVIKIVPLANQSQLKHIHLWVSSQSLIQRIELEDHFGTTTLLNLSDLQVNKLQANTSAALDKLFSFTPPEGTEILRQ